MSAMTPTTREQLATLRSADRGSSTTPRSIANSAACSAAPAFTCDWVRPGLALYGVSPFADQIGAELGLQPVMTLESTVIAMRRVPKGETVGYGGIWRAPARLDASRSWRPVTATGLPRSLPSGTPVLIDGQRAPLVGRVSMDMIAVDVTDLPPVRGRRSSVTLWGRDLPVEEIARHARTRFPTSCSAASASACR